MESTIEETETDEWFRWTRPLTLKLIGLLREKENENIYNTNHPDYVNRRKRTQTVHKMWLELRNMESSVTVDGIRTKIKSVRSQYINEFRRMQSIRDAGGTDEMCASSLWFFNEMESLHSYFNTRPLESTVRKKKNSIMEELEENEGEKRKKILFARPLIRKLISLLQENDIMFNVNNPDYHNKSKRLTVLQKMYNELRHMNESVTVEAIRVKISTLRSQFSSEKKRLQFLQPNDVGLTKLWCYDQLKFLEDHCKEVIDRPLEEVFIESQFEAGEQIEDFPKKKEKVKKTPKIREVELCRLCVNMTNTSHLENLFKEDKQKLLEQIQQLTGLQFRNTSNEPKYICKTCEEQTQQAYQFRERCIQSEAYFASADYRIQTNMIHEDMLFSEDQQEEDCDEDETLDDDELMMDFHEVLFNEESSNAKNDSGPDLSNSVPDDYRAADEEDESDKNIASEEEVWIGKSDESNDASDQVDQVIEVHIGANLKLIPNKNAGRKRRSRKKEPLICDQCGKHFSHGSSLKNHVKRHLNIKAFQCEYCPKAFLTKPEVQRHRRVHTGETPYPCTYCELRFRTCSKRLMHERRVHTKDKPFACEECDRRFTNSSELSRHRIWHTGIRPYECEVCNATFQENKHLKVHCLSLTHKKNEEKQKRLVIVKSEEEDFYDIEYIL